MFLEHSTTYYCYSVLTYLDLPLDWKYVSQGCHRQNFSEPLVLAEPWHIVGASYIFDKYVNVWLDRSFQTNSRCQGNSQWTFSHTGFHETLLLRNINRSPGLKTSTVKEVENAVYFISQKFTILIKILKVLVYFSINKFIIYVFHTFLVCVCVHACTQYLLELMVCNSTSCTTGFYFKLRNETKMHLSSWLLTSFCKGWANAVRPKRKKEGKKETAAVQKDKMTILQIISINFENTRKSAGKTYSTNKKYMWG